MEVARHAVGVPEEGAEIVVFCSPLCPLWSTGRRVWQESTVLSRKIEIGKPSRAVRVTPAARSCRSGVYGGRSSPTCARPARVCAVWGNWVTLALCGAHSRLCGARGGNAKKRAERPGLGGRDQIRTAFESAGRFGAARRGSPSNFPPAANAFADRLFFG